MDASEPRIPLVFLLVVILVYDCASQPSWKALPNAPTTNGKLNDCSFISATVGWVVGSGKIYRTNDGGLTWQTQLNSGINYFRSVGFADSFRGWVGSLDSDNLFQTSDGGINWAKVANLPAGPMGICGLSVVDTSVVYGCGWYQGNPFVVKTTNGGSTWSSIDMSQYATGLVDVLFFSRDSGLCVGTISGSPSTIGNSVVLSTTDGGSTWTERYRSPRSNELCWKICFVSSNVGYIAIEPFTQQQPGFYLKTTDRGITWQDIQLPFNNYSQGIGFTNGLKGWIGGFGPLYETTDGGLSWNTVGWGQFLNRFRMLNDSLGYAVGKTVYKYTVESIQTSVRQNNTIILPFRLFQNYPNPFNPITRIQYELGMDDLITISVHDISGRTIRTLLSRHETSGSHEIQFDSGPLPSGVYFCSMASSAGIFVIKLLLLR